MECLDALLDTKLNDWYEFGGLRTTKVQEGVLHIDAAVSYLGRHNSEKYVTGYNHESLMYLNIVADEPTLIDGGRCVQN